MTPIRFDRIYPLDQVEMDQIMTIENCSNLVYLGGRTGTNEQGWAMSLYIFVDKNLIRPPTFPDAYVPGPAYKEMDAHGLRVSAIHYAATVNLREILDAN